MDSLEDIGTGDPWRNSEAQRDDAEALSVDPEPIEAIEEWVLLATERVSIL